MKLLIPLKLFVLLLNVFPFCFSLALAQEVQVNVLTYNIRLATPGDAPNTWSARQENVFSVIRTANADVFGLQEALKEQVTDMEKAFPGFTRIGVGRDDGKQSGEFSPLFYNSAKFTLITSGTFWLSQTPSVPGSRGWDAACNRIVTWAQLKERETQIDFFVFCTHFDHMGEIARRNSAILILHSVDSIAGNKPAIVMGDFNSIPGSEPYRIITDTLNAIHLQDALLMCKNISGPSFTFSGFKVGAQAGERIDYIFLNRKIQVVSFQVNPANSGEYYPSDHLPVSATLRLN